MPSFSKVLKAEQVVVNGSTCRLPPYEEAGLTAVAAGEAPPHLIEAVSRITSESEQQATELLAAATLRCTEILASAENECCEIMRQAEMKNLLLEEEMSKRGYDSGYLQGLGAAQSEGMRLRREAEAMLQEAVQLRDRMLARVEPQAVELAVCVAEKLVGKQLALVPDTIVAIVRESLRLLKESGEILIRLHPGDLLLCQANLAELQTEVRENSTLNLFADPEMTAGNCRIETNGALIECVLDERFAALRAVLADVTYHE